MTWNKLTTRPLEDEEKEIYPDCDFIWEGKTPDVWDRVLVYTRGGVEIDTWEDFGSTGVGFENCDDKVEGGRK